jgi:hypothetical protein
MSRRATIRLLALLCAGLCAAPAAASDRCLIGRWQPDGNGAAEWMQRTAPGMRVSVDQQQGELELRADGRYVAHNRLQTRATSQGARGTAEGSFQAAGTWRAAEGHLTLVPERGGASGHMDVESRSGGRVRQALPSAAATTTRFGYRCSGDGLETSLQIPGSGVPMVQRYRRVAAD